LYDEDISCPNFVTAVVKLDLSFGAERFLVLVAATLIVLFQNPEVKLLSQLSVTIL